MNSLVNDVAIQTFGKPGNKASIMHLVIRLRNLMRKEEISYAAMADAFAVLSSWEGKRVVVDDIEWIPPLIPDEEAVTYDPRNR